MKFLTFLLFALILLFIATLVPHTLRRDGDASQMPVAENCDAFAEHIRACTPYACRMPHPDSAGVVVLHRILGIKDGKCTHIQEMPKATVECAYEEVTREALARTFLPASDPADAGRDAMTLREAFLKECKMR